MKPIGPYVAARDLTEGQPAGAVRTLRATDRLTGMPVLLHLLPHAAPLPELPPDTALLAPSEGGIDGDTAYVVTELPPHAQPAADPLLAARGALSGLAALHEAGLTHGGVSPAQLWSIDGRVALAGAGLPWGGTPTPQGDLRDLHSTLEHLGGVPAELRDVPDDLPARAWLDRLNAPPAGRVSPPPLEVEPPTPAAPPAPVVIAAAQPGPVIQATGTGEEQASAPSEAADSPAFTPTGRVPSRRVPGEPVRIRWNADGTRQVVKSGPPGPAPAPATRRGLPAWLWPLLLLLLALLAAGVWWARRSAASAPVPAASAPCCDVRFAVSGVSGVPVRLSLVSAPPGVKVDPDREVGRAPGVVRLPTRGTYTLRVAAQGYAPGTVTVEAPSAVPVRIALSP